MKKKIHFRIGLLTSVCLFLFWTSPAYCKLYPPCQNITFIQDAVNSIRYSVTDPISGNIVEDTWSLTKGDEHIIESAQKDQGIITWIAKYKNSTETDYTFEVHYCIYDPGRGIWKEGSWGPFNGYRTSLEQHQVKDGVVAWIAHRSEDYGPTSKLEHEIIYTTYDPELGSWPNDSYSKKVAYNSQKAPEILRVKNGVVACPWKNDSGNLGQGNKEVVCCIYHYGALSNPSYWSRKVQIFGCDLDWLQIPADLTRVEGQESCQQQGGRKYNFTLAYDVLTTWSFGDTPPVRTPRFVVYPRSGVTPFRPWFWDCSYNLDGAYFPSTWSWTVGPGQTEFGRSTSHLYTSPGQFKVYESVNYLEGGTFNNYNTSDQITALPPAPIGEISINNGAAYTNSTNVTFSLNYGPSAKEMCFRQIPGWIWWQNWQPVAPSINWILSPVHLYGTTSDGPQTVLVKFRDQYGTESQAYQTSIILDATPPKGTLILNNGALTAYNPHIQVSWSANDSYRLNMSYTYFNEGDRYYHWISGLDYQPTNMTIPFDSQPGEKTVIVRFVDEASNISQYQMGIKFIPSIYLPLIIKN